MAMKSSYTTPWDTIGILQSSIFDGLSEGTSVPMLPPAQLYFEDRKGALLQTLPGGRVLVTISANMSRERGALSPFKLRHRGTHIFFSVSNTEFIKKHRRPRQGWPTTRACPIV